MLLTFLGAGIIPGTMYGIAAGLLISLFILSNTKGKIVNTAHTFFCFCFVIIIWLTLNTLPLPSFFEKLTGEKRVEQNNRVRTAVQESQRIELISENLAKFSLSRNRMGTCSWIILIISAFSISMISACLNKKWQIRYLRFLVVLVTIIALLGILGQFVFPQDNRIWWLIPIEDAQPYACFINRNHFGGFIILLCPAVILLCARDFHNRCFITGILGIICFFIMSAGVVISMSRGAFLTYIISLFSVVIISINYKSIKKGLVICSLACFAFLAIILFVSGRFEKRLRTINDTGMDRSAQIRLTVWKDSIRVWRDFSIAGVGADGFHMIIPRYKTLLSEKSFHHAESMFVQVLVDGGIIGVILLVGFMIGYIREIRKNLLNNMIPIEVSASAVCALVCACIQGLVDVAPFIPLYTLVLSSLAGLPLAGFKIKNTENDELKVLENGKKEKIQNNCKINSDIGIKNGNIYQNKTRKLIRIYSILGLVIIGGFYSSYKLDVYKINLNSVITLSGPEKISQALIYSPTSWQAWYHFGRFAFMVPNRKGYELGERCMSMAAYYNPNDYRIWKNLFEIRVAMNDHTGSDKAYDNMLNTAPDSMRKTLSKLKKRKPLMVIE